MEEEDKMTIDEAIEHCEEKTCDTACGVEHDQLGEWLKELKELRKLDNPHAQIAEGLKTLSYQKELGSIYGRIMMSLDVKPSLSKKIIAELLDICDNKEKTNG